MTPAAEIVDRPGERTSPSPRVALGTNRRTLKGRRSAAGISRRSPPCLVRHPVDRAIFLVVPLYTDTLVPSAGLRYRRPSEMRIAVCLILEPEFVLWKEGAGTGRPHRPRDDRPIANSYLLTKFAVEMESSCHASPTNIDVRTPR